MLTQQNQSLQYINLTPSFNSLKLVELRKELKQLSNELGFWVT